MTSLSEQERKAYENYLLASNDEERQQAMKQLIPGSYRFYHLYFLDLFKSKGSKLTEQELKTLEKFEEKYPRNQFSEEIKMRLKFHKYDAAETEEERNSILEEVKNDISLNLNFTKPEGLMRQGESSLSSSQKDDLEEDQDIYDEKQLNQDYDEESCDEEQEILSGSATPKSDIMPAQRRQINAQQRLQQQNFVPMEMEQQNICNDLDDFGNDEMFVPMQQNTNNINIDRMMPDFNQQILTQPEEKGNKHTFNYQKYFSKKFYYQKLQKLQYANNENLSFQILSQLPKGFESEINFTKFHPSAIYMLACSLGTFIADIQNPSFLESLKRYLQKTPKDFLISSELCNNMTLSQLDKLAELYSNIKNDKNYIGAYFQKTFYEELQEENQENMTLEEKRSNLERLYAFAKNKEIVSLQSSLLIEILEIGIKIGVYDEDLFRSYLQIPLAIQPNLFKKEKERKANYETHWNNYLGSVQSQNVKSGNCSTTQSDLIQKYLEHFCQQNGNLEKFQDELDKDFLKQIELKVSIYNSDDMTNLNVDLKKYQAISQEVILRFLECNKEFYTVDEEVSLQLQLKNVPTLYIKIFEFNTETYYKKTLSPFNTAVNLDGMIAKEEHSFEYKQAPNKKFIETYKFPSLIGKIGLFIVEFIGNGMSARAVIKKGSLSLIHKSGVAGHIAYILDEKKNVCKGPKTGIYIQEEYFKADPEKNGQIFIPYAKSIVNTKAIMMNNDFAQLCDFQRKTESYSFSAWIYLNSESILIGNKAQVLIRPNLTVNDRKTKVELLQNSKVTLTLHNYIDGIPVTKTFENIQFKTNSEHIIDFQVPPYLQSIRIELTSELFNVTQQKMEKFSQLKSISVQTGASSTTSMAAMYLRKENSDYYIYVLGKNGEVKQNMVLSMTLRHPKYQFLQSTNFNLRTDKEGKVKLGHLRNIQMINASVSSLGLSNQWWINTKKQSLTYPHNIDTIEMQTLEFPVIFNKKSRKQIGLIRLNKNIVLEDLFDKIDFIEQEGKLYNLIQLKNLEQGEYILSIKGIEMQIKITIHKGEFWENENWILKKNCLFENSVAQKMIKIESVQSKIYSHPNILVEEGKTNGSDITIKLKDFAPETRVHCIASQFLNSHYGMKQILLAKFSKTVFPFAQWKNIYISNRELSDEFRYVFDRKYAERFVGSSLDRPKLVLRRNLVQTTQIDREVLNQGKSYQNVAVKESYSPRYVEQRQQIQARSYQNVQPQFQYQQQQLNPMSYLSNAAPMSYSQNIAQQPYQLQSIQPDFYLANNCQSAYYDYAGGYGSLNSNFGQEYENYCLSSNNDPKEFQNFLKNIPHIEFNLIPNENGEVKFSANLNAFTQLAIIAVNPDSSAYTEASVPANSIQKRDLSLNQTLDLNKGFTESRTTVVIKKGENHLIEDITSTEMQIVDDLNKVRSVLEEIMKHQGTSGVNIFKNLNVLMKWFKMSKDDKNNSYSMHACHELNIFIYFKDHEYFEEVVKPHLKNKMEKTFVDYYLLGEYEQLLKYKEMINHNKLNALESCFLIDALIKSSQLESAKIVLNYMKMNSSNTKADIRVQNQLFDVVLNMNNLKKDQIGQIQQGKYIQKLQNIEIPVMPSSASYEMAPPPSYSQNSAINDIFGGNLNRAGPRPPAGRRLERKTSEICYNRAYDSCSDEDDDFAMNEEEDCIQERVFKNKKVAVKKAALFDEMEHISRQIASKQRKINFEEIEETKEYNEMQYLKQINYQESQYKIALNSFYIDYAEHLINEAQSTGEKVTEFVSSNFIQSEKSAFVVLSLMSLPLEAPSHDYKTNEGRGMTITAQGNMILYKKAVKEAEIDIKNDIMVTHRYINLQNTNPSYDEEGNQIETELINKEFLINHAYECEIIITNVSPKNKEFTLLYQIPQGSLPLQLTKYVKSIPKSLSPYTTDKVKFYFYFPQEGEYIHFPTNVAINEKVIARAETLKFKTVKHFTILKKETFKDILIGGSKQDILEFLKTHNLIKGEKGFDFFSMLWMLKDKQFFSDVIQILRSRLIFNEYVWSYAFYHKNDELAIQEYIAQVRPYPIIQKLGTFFSSKLISINEYNSELKHLDYFPWINARVHSVGEHIQHWSLNKNFKNTYEKFLQSMIQLKELTVAQKLQLVYYMNFQDRSSESIALFKSIKESDLPNDQTLKIQYDYMSAYFDFYTGAEDGFKIARSIVRKYEDYPVISWRVMFLQMLDQLNEYDGEIDEEQETEGLGENQTEDQKKNVIKKQAKKEPQLKVEVSTEKQLLQIESYNVKNVVIKYYIIDAEILFSRTPFLKENTEEFSYVKPCLITEETLMKDVQTGEQEKLVEINTEIMIPADLKNKNMVIEINGAKKQIFKSYFSAQLKVNVIENFGELKVTDLSNKPLPKVYVKVFAQKKGQSKTQATFFRDGYTDIRGKFEYSATSGQKVKNVETFAILVMSDSLGSIIKECKPPQIEEEGSGETEEVQINNAKVNRLIERSKGASKPMMKSKK